MLQREQQSKFMTYWNRQESNARPTLWHARWRLASDGAVLFLDCTCNVSCSSMDEASGEAMSAMSNLHLELTTAMNHIADKLREATEDGWGETKEATCNVSIELLQICADAFAQVREMSEGVKVGH
jgi:hypothetical protein